MEKFYSVELGKDYAEKLKAFLNAEGIYYEPSACYNLIHFEIKLDEAEVKKVSEFLEAL